MTGNITGEVPELRDLSQSDSGDVGSLASSNIIPRQLRAFSTGTMFSSTGTFGAGAAGTGLFGTQAAATTPTNPNKDYELPSPPDDTVQTLRFSPATVQQNFLASGSWDGLVRLWEVNIPSAQQNAQNQVIPPNIQAAPKAQQTAGGPVMDLSYSDDGSKIFFGSTDKTLKMWDLNSNQVTQIGSHDGVIKSVHFIQGGNYQCVMTGSWDKTLKFWDARQPNPMMVIALPERLYAADVLYPMAAVCTAGKQCVVYQLDGTPREFKKVDTSLKNMLRCLSICTDPKTRQPTGFAVGSVEGRVAIQYLNPPQPKDNFTFKCHRVDQSTNVQEIYPVNGVNFHPVHGTLATLGGDCKYSYWDKDSRTKLKTSEKCDQALTTGCFSARGEVFAYGVGYDWGQGHEFSNPAKKPQIFLNYCFEDMKPRKKT
ncbi:mRNA export factor [Hypsibius exemplaris]|uniref:mRNA export factor n=1 Tax=Hypsibius exemplaris TaxID=2072580 RepID=A0A1W0X3C2_HYPEX|nr:mRNA export factor [Hypsibius exemplaris]